MSVRYKPLSNPAEKPIASMALPLDRPIAVYYRQSTDAQVGNISTLMQTVDMRDVLIRYGWNPDNVILIDVDKGISGTTAIHEREGMRELYGLIVGNRIGAIACQDEDRLFRDVSQIQVNIFIKACKEHNVIVMTPTMIYDFAHPQTGNFHARQFRFKAEMAAEYITAYIKGKLNAARTRLQMSGRWAGGFIPPGYMVDDRKTISGVPNPNFRLFVPFEPYAQVVRAYYDLFLETGSLWLTCKKIAQSGPWYPNERPPEGFRVMYNLKAYSRRNTWTTHGLQVMLTNAIHIGHWTVSDTITRWNNHEPIVDSETFYKAFNLLSQTTLSGEPNTSHRDRKYVVQHTNLDERPEPPLLSGMLFADRNGKDTKVGTLWVGDDRNWIYTLRSDLQVPIWRRLASHVDALVADATIKKLKATLNDQTWGDEIELAQRKARETTHLIEEQIKSIDEQMESCVQALNLLKTAQMIAAVEERYNTAFQQKKSLEAEIERVRNEFGNTDSLEHLRKSLLPALTDWPQMNREERRKVIDSCVSRIFIVVENSANTRITITWRDNTTESFGIAKRFPRGNAWLKEEVDLLLQVVQTNDQVAIASAFPDRTWDGIREKLNSLGVKLSWRGHLIGYRETYNQAKSRLSILSTSNSTPNLQRLARGFGTQSKTLNVRTATAPTRKSP